MRTPTTRRHYSRTERRYGSDRTDAKWDILASFLPGEAPCRRKRARPMRDVVNVIRYILRRGASGRPVPTGFPPRRMVSRRFVRLRDDGTWELINHDLVRRHRERAGREASPTGAVIDSQSIETTDVTAFTATRPARIQRRVGCREKSSASRTVCSQKRRCQSPRSPLAAREAERSSPGGIAAENQRLISAQRVEYAASPSGSVHTACMCSGRTTQASIRNG